MAARFFVDENDLALGRALAGLHAGDVVFPGHADLPEVPRQSQDDDWLPVIGTARLVVITRDQRIRYRPVEKRMWVEHNVRGFALTGRKSQSTAASLALLQDQWARLEGFVESEPDGPWMYAVTHAGLRSIELG